MPIDYIAIGRREREQRSQAERAALFRHDHLGSHLPRPAPSKSVRIADAAVRDRSVSPITAQSCGALFGGALSFWVAASGLGQPCRAGCWRTGPCCGSIR